MIGLGLGPKFRGPKMVRDKYPEACMRGVVPGVAFPRSRVQGRVQVTRCVGRASKPRREIEMGVSS